MKPPSALSRCSGSDTAGVSESAEANPDAAALANRLLEAFDEASGSPKGFARVRDAMDEETEYVAVAERIGGAMGRAQLELIDPAIVCDYGALSAATMDGPNVFEGHDGWIEMWRLWFEPWEWFEWAERRIEPIDHDHALFTATGRCKGRTSGVVVEIPQNGVWTARDGRLVAYRAYDTPEEALASLEGEGDET